MSDLTDRQAEINCLNCMIMDFKESLCDNCAAMKRRGTAKDLEKLIMGMPRWIPCEEALPEERRAVLVYAPLRKNTYMAYHDSVYGWMTWDPIFSKPFPVSGGVITAWMEPPEPYKEEE